jgi:hypothetical protein
MRFLPLLLLLAASAHAQLAWEKPVQRFERSPEDKAVEARYAFRNAGSAPITIRSLRSSCGCTTARLEQKTYAPGESGAVTLRFAFGDRKGAHRKGVTVHTDEQGAAPVVLLLEVNIHEPLTLAPALVFWRKGDAPGAKTVALDATAAQPVRIQSVASTNPRFTATLQTGAAGQHYTVAITPADTAQKDAAEIRVQTDFPADAPRAYTIHARVK